MKKLLIIYNLLFGGILFKGCETQTWSLVLPSYDDSNILAFLKNTPKAAFSSWLLIILATFLLSACSQKDADTIPGWVWQCNLSNTSDNSDFTDYYPLGNSETARWSYYRHSGLEFIPSGTGTGGKWIEDEDSYENTQNVADSGFSDSYHTGDYQYYRSTDSPNENSGKVSQSFFIRESGITLRAYKKEYLSETPNQSTLEVAYYSNGKGVDGFKRFDENWLSMDDGWSETLSYDREVVKNTETDGDPAGSVDDRTHKFTVVSHSETVTVPAGTFKNCLKMKRQRIRAANERGDDKFYWFCPGVGKVKEEEIVDDGNPRVEELLYYCIPGGLCCE